MPATWFCGRPLRALAPSSAPAVSVGNRRISTAYKPFDFPRERIHEQVIGWDPKAAWQDGDRVADIRTESHAECTVALRSDYMPGRVNSQPRPAGASALSCLMQLTSMKAIQLWFPLLEDCTLNTSQRLDLMVRQSSNMRMAGALPLGINLHQKAGGPSSSQASIRAPR